LSTATFNLQGEVWASHARLQLDLKICRINVNSGGGIGRTLVEQQDRER
jgi:hypothetical protein